MTRIAVVGAGRIGGNLAQLLAAKHDVTVSFTRDRAALTDLAAKIGVRVADPAAAVAASDVVVLSVPWPVVEQALAATGPLDGKVVIDTTNPFGRGGTPVPPGMTSTQLHQGRLPGAHLVKAFNTLTSGFQAAAAGRPEPERVVIFLAGDSAVAKETVSGLVRDAGFEPVDVGRAADSAVLEAPRRPGAVYGEEYHLADAEAVVAAVRAGRVIPPIPVYEPTSAPQ